ncbi:DNA-processing protein DprA [Microbacterium sp. LRZ72]|uniref:DNA-processing protein DprA n=1 Tax=Microbacterium sp. LRZ72 TaxID=2942481 RepID=UPI0029B7A00D|nr:DNA-processing protein DprA [Microbacterium sp. LRZ72]MDX2375567.1 DNA-processing protein DprA [Microbacterium sp. LRZ72]
MSVMTRADLSRWDARARRDALGWMCTGDDDHVRDAWARAVWTMLAEPGDGVAGRLIAELGADNALSLVASAATAPTLPDGDASALLPADIAQGLARWRPRLSADAVRAVFHTGRAAGLTLVTPDDTGWPARLADLAEHAPHALWVKGDAAWASSAAAIALVGARAATGYGENVALELASQLAAHGVTVVSGAAFGIDGAAHRAALLAGGGTVAVLAGGAEKAYPSGHRELLRRVASAGAVVAEVAPGTAPTKWRFLARNRVIAALSDAVIVVEAGWRSGSLNTAGHAASLGRPLGAVPGPVTSAASAGCHRLLRDYDATCVTGIDDALELIGARTRWGGSGADGGTDDRTRALDALSVRQVRDVSEIARRAGMSETDAAAVLGLLELEGLAARDIRGWRRAAAGARAR